ncbi:MAG: glycosyltransferase family 9 protein [Candidatus Kapaibacterium sp.]
MVEADWSEEEELFFDPEKTKRIAVFRPGTLGDMILTTPLFSALKEVFPEAELTVIANPWNSIIPENHPAVKDVFVIPSGAGGIPMWLLLFAFRRFDLYIDPKDHRSTTSRFAAELVRSKRKLVVPQNIPIFSGFDIIPPPTSPHFVDSALAPMLAIAPEREFRRHPSFQIPDTAKERIAEAIGEKRPPLLLLNISTGSQTRRWPEEKWCEFVKRVKWSGQIVVISSPSDQESGKRVAYVRENALYQPTDNLMEAAALVQASDRLVTSDTSIVHVAAAFNKPIIALYFNAPKMMAKFSPLSDDQRIIVAPDENPVAVIEVDEVLETFTKF